jgi:hypothetical protein
MWIVDVILCVFWFLFLSFMMFFIWVFKQTSNPPSIDQLKQASDPPSIDQIKQTSDLPCIDHQLKQTPYLPRTDQLSCIDQLKEELLCAVSFLSHFYSAFVSFLLCF